MKVFGLFVLCLIGAVVAEVYFEETFSDGDAWESRWVHSSHKGDEAENFERTAGKYYGEKANAFGIQTPTDAKFYQISAKLDKDFSNKGKDLVIQYTVKHEQNIDCGGGYIKLLPAGLDQEDFSGDSDYNIMFGPDICGSGTKKVHAIFNYKGENYLTNRNIRCKDDELTHIYTMIVKPDQTYQILIDNEEVQTGSIVDHWDMLEPKRIKDPAASKPADWVDEEHIADPDDVKPEGWDDEPEYIVDPDASKPEDWDDELDGEWEAPQIPNPEYKGEWTPKEIDNPDFSGPWIHPMIDNPDYVLDENIYAFDSHAFIGLEIWQVKAGTIFDNFLVTDDVDLASTRAEAILKDMEVEKELFEEAKEEERRAAEEAAEEARKEAEAAAANAEDDEEDVEDVEDAEEDIKVEL